LKKGGIDPPSFPEEVGGEKEFRLKERRSGVNGRKENLSGASFTRKEALGGLWKEGPWVKRGEKKNILSGVQRKGNSSEGEIGEEKSFTPVQSVLHVGKKATTPTEKNIFQSGEDGYGKNVLLRRETEKGRERKKFEKHLCCKKIRGDSTEGKRGTATWNRTKKASWG